jgi:AAA15 family ATPase/GTPase
VGKSNILEALSLFSVPFLDTGENINRLIRVENKNELFYNVSGKSCSIETNLAKVQFEANLTLKYTRKNCDDEAIYQFAKNLDLESTNDDNHEELQHLSNVMRYIFHQEKKWKSIGDELLLPPFGENIIDTLMHGNNVSALNAWIKTELAKFGLEHVLDMSNNSIRVQRRLEEGKVMSLPYTSIADTLQRIIFYKTAIASNENAVLLFEEPEAHAFPPYIKTITQDIINSVNNQFFMATHSAIVVNDFIEYADLRKEVAIYLVDFKNGQTVAKLLSDEEVNEVYNYGEDLFYNTEKFL